MPEDVAIASTKSEVDTSTDDRDIDRPKSADRQTDGRTDGFSALYSTRHRLSDTYYSRTPLQQKLKDFRIIQWHHRVGQHERYLHTNFEADRTNHVGTMTN